MELLPSIDEPTPLERLLMASPEQMTDEQLAVFVGDMRSLRQSAPTRKAAVKGTAPNATKTQNAISKFL